MISAGANNHRDEPYEIAAGVEAIMARLRTMFPSARISALSILPRGRNLSQGRFEEANLLIRSAVEAAGQLYVDAYPVFRSRCGYADRCSLYTDSVHLSDEGYQVLGDLLKN